MIRYSVLILAPLLALAACKGGKSETAKPAGPPEQGMKLELPAGAAGKGAQKTAEVMRMHKVAGRWQSQPGVLPGGANEWLALDVSNDMRFVLSVRSPAPGGKGEAVSIEVRGPIVWTPEGVLTGTGQGAKPPIKDFGSWRGSFPRQGTMTVRAADGKSYDLTYRGL